MNEIKVGDKVMCRNPGSWTDGKVGVVQRLNVRTTDGICGHQLKMPGCITVVASEHLERAD